MNFRGFVERLKVYFEESGDNASALSTRSGFDKSMIRQWLNGNVGSARAETIRQVCERGMGTTYEAFMGIEIDPVLLEIQQGLLELEPQEQVMIRDQIRGIRAARAERQSQ